MKKKIISALMLSLTIGAFAQSGIGIGTKTVNPAAILEVDSADKGVLLPRIDIADVSVFGLGTATAVESMIIYNSNPTTVGGKGVGYYYWVGGATPHWEKVADQTQITNLDNRVTQIEGDITNITGGGSADLSFLIRFRPKGTALVAGGVSTEDKMFFLKPDGAGGYTEEPIAENYVSMFETKTFIRDFSEDVMVGGSSVSKITGYVYFSEEAIIAWLATPGNEGKDPYTEMPNTAGKRIDIVGTVNSNIENIFEGNDTFIKNYIAKHQGNVTIKYEGDNITFTYIDESSGSPVTVTKNFQELVKLYETQTSIGVMGSIAADDDVPTAAVPSETAPGVGTKKGEVYFEYVAEHGKKYYINVTSAIIESVTNNETLKDSLTTVVQNIGGSVFYGPITVGGPNVLYNIVGGTKTVIDISETLKEVLESKTMAEYFNTYVKEFTETRSTNTVHYPTGEFINGSPIYKGIANDAVVAAPGASTFTNPITIAPHKLVYNETTKAWEAEAIATPKLKRLLNAQVLTTDGSVVTTLVNDVVGAGSAAVNYHFGSGIMYTQLPGDTYEVVFEYTIE